MTNPRWADTGVPQRRELRKPGDISPAAVIPVTYPKHGPSE